MTALDWIMLVAAGVCLFAWVMVQRNLARYRPPPADCRPEVAAGLPLVSVCVPARDEEANLEACVRSILASDHAAIEVLVYDDHSTDATPVILARLMNEDPRVRAAPVQPLPQGWNGKQFACEQLGRAAAGRWLLFTDADVRFAPGAVGGALAAAVAADAALVSTFPRQITGALGERLLVPMIHFLLFAYLPMGRMRATLEPAASAGCGQFLFVRADAYRAAGGHAAFADSMHDGIKMPRALRRAGFRTDLFDGTDLCACRMYRGFAAAWRGFAKNAFEGLGSLALLVVITILHAVGHVLPWGYLALVLLQAVEPSPPAVGLALTAAVLQAITRTSLALRFQTPLHAALLHPVSIVLMTGVQWHSLYLAKFGTRQWRGRTAGPPGSAPALQSVGPAELRGR